MKIKLSNGVVIDTDDVKADSILVLIGRGLTDWLLHDKDRSKEFHAAPHAVEALGSMPYSGRSVFARMKVAPLAAVPVNGIIKFKNVFFNEDILHEVHPTTLSENILGMFSCWMKSAQQL